MLPCYEGSFWRIIAIVIIIFGKFPIDIIGKAIITIIMIALVIITIQPWYGIQNHFKQISIGIIGIVIIIIIVTTIIIIIMNALVIITTLPWHGE